MILDKSCYLGKGLSHEKNKPIGQNVDFCVIIIDHFNNSRDCSLTNIIKLKQPSFIWTSLCIFYGDTPTKHNT